MVTPTGFIDLDKILEGGLREGRLYLLGSRPGIGKTTLAANIIDYICSIEKKTALLFSLEFTYKHFVERFVYLEESLKDKIAFVDDTCALSIEELRDKSITYKALHESLSVIFVDYLQLMQTTERFNSRNKELSAIISGLKATAMELNVPIIALCQVAKTVEWRKKHIPILEDVPVRNLSYKDIDGVMILHRDDFYNTDSEKRGIAEIYVYTTPWKTGEKCELAFLPDFKKFASLKRVNV